MRRLLAAVVAVGVLVGMGCVQIPKKFEAHITVDIRHHIEQQAGSTLDFIEGKTDTLPSAATSPAPGGQSWLMRARDMLSPIGVAYAAELNANSPEITRIATEMRKRFDQIDALKKKGYAGENNRGYVELRGEDKISSSDERNLAQRLVAAENKDRKALYNEVAKLNKDQNVNVSMVERIYAQAWLKRAKSGEIFQLPPNGEDFEAFKASAAGQALGTACEPDAWVVMK